TAVLGAIIVPQPLNTLEKERNGRCGQLLPLPLYDKRMGGAHAPDDGKNSPPQQEVGKVDLIF
ncbi:hypothetical protein OFB99_27170, partial [Escherichia coli]|nr:hypothetical protein [Escherichia coli]